MAFKAPVLQDIPGVWEQVFANLNTMLTVGGPVDIITFAEHADYLGQRLYPRQRLALKLFYKVPLDEAELADARYLLTCPSKYARLYFPGIRAEQVPALSDDALRERLLLPNPYILMMIAGRRGSKSVLGAVVNAYQLYTLLADPDPQRTWGLIPGQEIGTANVATDEDQALILFNQMTGLLENSPWFRNLRANTLQTKLEFLGRHIVARSLHSNSSSVRGKTLCGINFDEFCHLGRTLGKLSDNALWQALEPSILTFHDHGIAKGKIVVTSSPLNKAGKGWELFSEAEEGKTNKVIAFQLATWEMNPTLPRDHEQMVEVARRDPDYFEQEYGAQWAAHVGYFIPAPALEACLEQSKGHRPARRGPAERVYAHLDLSKNRDSTALAIVHYERETGDVVVDRWEEFSPSEEGAPWVNERGEIDQEWVFSYLTELATTHGFHFRSITFDNYNSAWLQQRLRRYFPNKDVTLVEEKFPSDKRNRESYGTLRSTIVQAALRLFFHQEGLTQLRNLSKIIKTGRSVSADQHADSRSMEDSGNWKVECPKPYHDDMADALCEAVKCCLDEEAGVTSDIRVVGKRRAADSAAPLLPAEAAAELVHDKGCTKVFCVFGCPVQAARALAMAR